METHHQYNRSVKLKWAAFGSQHIYICFRVREYIPQLPPHGTQMVTKGGGLYIIWTLPALPASAPTVCSLSPPCPDNASQHSWGSQKAQDVSSFHAFACALLSIHRGSTYVQLDTQSMQLKSTWLNLRKSIIGCGMPTLTKSQVSHIYYRFHCQ